MHNTDVKKPAGSSNSAAGDTDEVMVPDTCRPDKAFSILVMRLFLAGQAIYRNNPAEGAVLYFAASSILNRVMLELTTAIQYLVQIGGVH